MGVGIGSEQSGIRPVIIVQNNTGNKHSSTTIVVPTTTKAKNELPTHFTFLLNGKRNIALAEQQKSIAKARLKGNKIYSLNKDEIEQLDKVLAISIAL